MATSVTDTEVWRLIVPLKPALNLTGSRLVATMTGQWGGAPAAVIDSADGSISWTPDPATGLTSALLITVPQSARGDWAAIGANGLPGPVPLLFDVKRGVGGAVPKERLGRSSVLVYPGTDAPAVLAQRSSFQPVLIAITGAGATLQALTTGPQGPGFPLPAFDPVADAGKTFGLRVVNGALMWVALTGSETTDPGTGPGSGSEPTFFATLYFPPIF